MDSISKYNTGFGRLVMADQQSADGTQKHFTWEQKQLDILTVPDGLADGTPVGISFRFGGYNQHTKAVHGIDPLRGAWTTVSVPYDTDGATTAAALKIAIEAELSSPAEISVADNLDGTMDVNILITALMVQWSSLVNVSVARVKETFDLDCYRDSCYLIGVVTGGKIRYNEITTSLNPSPTAGKQVENAGVFNIYGNIDIKKATFVEDTANAVVDYGIFI